MKEKKVQKKYLIELEEKRSLMALTAGILVFFIVLSAVLVKALEYNGTQVFPLHYFTVLSNLLTSISSLMMVPYAAEGIRKKRFVLPRWIVLFQYWLSGLTGNNTFLAYLLPVLCAYPVTIACSEIAYRIPLLSFLMGAKPKAGSGR